jgi:hypothetical protein
MATEYGYARGEGSVVFMPSREDAERVVRGHAGFTLVAREVSEPRIVSIRA